MTSTSTLTDGILCITLTGNLGGSPNTQQPLSSVSKYLGELIINCILELSAVRCIKSAGIGMLISLLTKLRSRDSEMVFITPAGHSKKMRVLTQLSNIFIVAANQAVARQNLIITAT